MPRLTEYSDKALPYNFRNKIINGDMRIDQRRKGGTATISYSGIGPYGTGEAAAVDRWKVIGGDVTTLGRSYDAPAGFNYSLFVRNDTSNDDLLFIQQRIEANLLKELNYGTNSPKTITISFWVKSAVAGLYGGTWQIDPSNLVQSAACFFTYTVTNANTWEYKTVTIPGSVDYPMESFSEGVAGGRLWFVVNCPVSQRSPSQLPYTWHQFNKFTVNNVVSFSSGGSERYFNLTGVQLEVRATATPFEYRPISLENLLCMRYYVQPNFFATHASQENQLRQIYNWPEQMCNIPVAVTEDYVGSGANQVSQLSKNYISILAGTAGGTNQTSIHNWVYNADSEL